MLIKKIKAKNFYSFKELELDFTNLDGLIQIVGENKDSGGSNGSGKSILFEAVCFGLFGKTIRKSTEESLINFIAGKDCYVEVEVEHQGINFKLSRTKRPTSLNLFINDVCSNKESQVETQKYFESLVCADYKSFLASVVFGQHTNIDFLSSSPEDKRIIIKNCFNLEEIFKRRDSIKEIKSLALGEGKALKAVLTNTEKELRVLKDSIPDSKYQLIDLPPLQDILVVEKSMQDLKEKSATGKSELSKLRKIQKKLEESLEKGVYSEIKECPVCKSDYEVDQSQDKVDKLKVEKETIDKQIKSLERKISTWESKLKKLKPKFTSSEWAKYNDKNSQILKSQSTIEAYNSALEKAKGIEESIKALDMEVEVMKFWERAFSEQGLIRYVIRNILEYFNLKSNEYLSIITNNQFSIKFDDDLSEEIKNCGNEVKFISLSGGERRKVNLAIMLALQDLQSKISGTNSNLIFFDEVGENLDDLSMEAIFNLLHMMRTQDLKKVILVITHNSHLQSLFSDYPKIKVIKKKGVSSIDGSGKVV